MCYSFGHSEREWKKKCDCLLHVQALVLFFLFSFFRMYWIQSLQAFTSSPWAWWLWLLTLTHACWLEGWDVFKCIYSMLSNIKPSCIGIDSLLEHYSKFKQAFTPEWLVFLFLKERRVLKVWLCKKRKNTPNMSSLHTHEHTHVECNGCMLRCTLFLQIMCFLLAVLLCAESYILFSIITFNRPRTETQNT